MSDLKNLSVCFDLDGTLIDTAPDLIRVLNQVIAEEGAPETDYEAARNKVGVGAKILISEALQRAGLEVSETRLNELRALFLDLYEQNIAQLSKPYPGVVTTLRGLREQGVRLSICTNKPGYLARPLIEMLGLTIFFDRIIGSGDGVIHKPNPDHIFAAVGHRNKDKIVMIGDASPDVAAARNAGVPVILMSYGYADTPPARLRADRVLRNFRDLPHALKDLQT